jgi:hypothetical protein
MPTKNACLALYRTHRRAVDAFRSILETSLDQTAVSVIGKPDARWPGDCYDTLYRSRLLAQVQGREPWSSWAVLWVPGLGCLLSHGPLAVDLIRETGMEDLDAGATALGVVLQRIGIPGGSVARYEMALVHHQSFVIAQGSRFQVEGVGDLLGRSDALEIAIHAG